MPDLQQDAKIIANDTIEVQKDETSKEPHVEVQATSATVTP